MANSTTQLRSDNLLQSFIWRDFQAALGRKVYGDEKAWGVEMGSRGVRYLYAPYGPDDKSGLDSLSDIAREAGVDFLRVEPRHILPADLKRAGFRRVQSMQPSHTQLIDLSQELVELRKGLTSGHRSGINGAERKGISVQIDPNGLDIFLSMIHETAKLQQFSPHSDHYYKTIMRVLGQHNNARIWIARVEGVPAASAIEFRYQNTSYYAHAGASQELNRKSGAAVVLVWSILMQAKEDGLKVLDLWGVAPAGSPNHPWAGLSKFKRSFGGETVEYAGTWDFPLKPVKYWGYRLLKRFLKFNFK